MKLSDIVAYRRALDQYDVTDMYRSTRRDLDKIDHEVSNSAIQIKDFTKRFNQKIQDIDHYFKDFGDTLNELKRDLDEQIVEYGRPYFIESYRQYNKNLRSESAEDILGKSIPLSADTRELLIARVRSYGDWRYPGMILHPGKEDFVEHMVSLDPLYLVDREHDLISPALSRFTPEYQRRLRPYYIRENTYTPILDKIPNNQFGFCLAYNFFEFKPLEMLKIYLTELYQKLRPGGILAMTFNDCDRAHCVALAESKFACYTPGSMVRELARSLGYEIVFDWNDNGNLTWLELKKPGDLTSIRAGQTLAKIVAKSK